ncbi:hypothetical protein H5410_021215 [Solanum commersonii]|uniref:Uncharacterized protein n=1 Tax=Solanum commersonii TaxID=4109 RepID=A0A9J5ZGH5_SOLCO|nr:hypothetical protein H5410_021215 [Solanum commersonii]
MLKSCSTGENSIYYNAGFKSYEITKCKTEAESWSEQSRYLLRRVKISHKVLRWLTTVFIEVSKEQGKVVRRWKTKDYFSEFFCTLKNNENVRYISFIAIQGQNIAVIITPETTFRGGWGNIAHKIAKFIYEPERIQEQQQVSTKKLESSYKDAFKSSRWMTESTKKAKIQNRASGIKISGEMKTSDRDLMNRCIADKFQHGSSGMPQLDDVRRWASNT